MKIARRVLYLITLLTDAAAAFICYSLQGNKIFEYSVNKGHFLVLAYRISLPAALVFSVAALAIFFITFRVHRHGSGTAHPADIGAKDRSRGVKAKESYKFCYLCGERLPEDADFCLACGADQRNLTP